MIGGTAAADHLDPGTTLCLHPVRLPVEERASDDRRANLEKRLRDALVVADFKVPDPQAVADLMKELEAAGGKVVDPATGVRDEAQYRALRARQAAALRDRLGCDAQLMASVVHVRARFSGGTATWDGTTDSVSSTGRVILNALGGVHESGWVAALSLWLLATDLEGEDLAFRSAGIESLVSLAVVQDEDVLPQDLWLTNGAKLDAAIRSALGSNGEGLRQLGKPPGGAVPHPTPMGGEVDYRKRFGHPSEVDR